MPKFVNTLANLLHAGPVVALSAASEDGRGAWMLILPAGEFKARDGRGPWRAGDEAQLRAIVERTLNYAGGTELMVDYDHQAAKTDAGNRAEAAGWVKALEARADGIWARIEWTEAAAAKIAAREYRYLSPLFLSDKKTGAVQLILNVALVNMPALDLDAIAASLSLNNGPETMDKILEALGLAKGTSEDAIVTALTALVALRASIVTTLGLAASATNDQIVTALKADDGKLAEALGLKAGASQAELIAAAAKLQKGGQPDPAQYAPVTALTALQTELNTLKAKLNSDEAEREVGDAIEAGKLTPALREWGLALFASDPKAFRDYVGSAVTLTTSQLSARTTPAGEPSLSETDRIVARQLGLSEADMLASRKELNQ